MIVNTAYPYMARSPEKSKNLFDGAKLNYDYYLGNSADSFTYITDHWRLYNATTGSRQITFTGVDLRDFSTLEVVFANGPKSNKASVSFLDSNQSLVNYIDLGHPSVGTKSMEIPIPEASKRENMSIRFNSGLVQNYIDLYIANLK